MIHLKGLSEVDIFHLIKKGGLLIYSQHNCADPFLVLKTLKKNHSFNHKVFTYDLRTHSKKELNTVTLWRNRQYWAYIPATSEKR